MSAASNARPGRSMSNALGRDVILGHAPACRAERGSRQGVFTPRSKPQQFIAMWPWSWYIVSPQSHAPRLARRKTVYAGTGPSTRSVRAASPGAMTRISLCGRNYRQHRVWVAPATAMRGTRKPALRMQGGPATSLEGDALFRQSAGTREGMCEVTRAFTTVEAVNSCAPSSPKHLDGHCNPSCGGGQAHGLFVNGVSTRMGDAVARRASASRRFEAKFAASPKRKRLGDDRGGVELPEIDEEGLIAVRSDG